MPGLSNVQPRLRATPLRHHHPAPVPRTGHHHLLPPFQFSLGPGGSQPPALPALGRPPHHCPGAPDCAAPPARTLSASQAPGGSDLPSQPPRSLERARTARGHAGTTHVGSQTQTPLPRLDPGQAPPPASPTGLRARPYVGKEEGPVVWGSLGPSKAHPPSDVAPGLLSHLHNPGNGQGGYTPQSRSEPQCPDP